MIDLSIIIINYNTFELTCQCIESVVQETKNISYEILLIDNASRETDSKHFLDKFPAIKLYTLPQNVGFGRANNYGMERAEGKYFLLLNSDTIILDGALDKCVEHFNSLTNERVGMLGCKVLYPNGEHQLSAFLKNRDHLLRGIIKKQWYKNPIVQLFSKHNKVELLTEVEKNKDDLGGLYGCFVLLKSEVYESCQGFDPDFFMYCEETNWFRKRVLAKYTIQYFDRAQIIHIAGGSDPSGVMIKQNALSYYLYWYKFSKVHFWFYLLSHWVNLLTSLFFIPFWRNKKRLDQLYIIKIHLKLLKQVLLDIPKYGNHYGARDEFLILNELKK